jgi:Flp pilus assembly protein CpaB
MVLSMKRPGQGGGEDVERSQFLLQNIQVLAVGATAITNASSQGGGGRVNQGKGSQNLTAVTLSIPEGQVVRVVYAAEHGSIYLTLMPPQADPAPRAADVDAGNVIPER